MKAPLNSGAFFLWRKMKIQQFLDEAGNGVKQFYNINNVHEMDTNNLERL